MEYYYHSDLDKNYRCWVGATRYHRLKKRVLHDRTTIYSVKNDSATVSRHPLPFNTMIVYLSLCVSQSIYIKPAYLYVLFLIVSFHFVMWKLSLTSLVSEITNCNQVDDSQYNL